METKKKLLNPKNDYVFKRIFGYKGNENITKALLENITGTKINKIEIKEDTNLYKNLIGDKVGILDIKAILDNEIHTDIEMQIANNKSIIHRILFYWSKMYISNLSEGEEYKKLKKTIIVLFADFELEELKVLNNYYSKWQIKEAEEGKIVLTNLFEIYIIELPKCKNNKKENKELDNWIEFLKNPEKMGEKDMSEEIKEAKKCLEKISKNEEEIRWAELREKYVREINTAKAEGREEAFEEGLKDGKKEAKKTIAKNMLNLKIDIEIISKATGLTKEEIQELNNK